jgi:NAD+ synthase (glutamine-hydrolysing)
MRLALAQLDPVVGDIAGNAEQISAAYRQAVAAGADLVATPELMLTGYPPEDLVLKRAFVAAGEVALQQIAATTGGAVLIVGFVEGLAGRTRQDEAWRAVASDASPYPLLANAAAVCRNGRVEALYRKHRLPNYGVFDEARYFQAGTRPLVVEVAGTRVGITVCEDMWGPGGPVAAAAQAGAQLVVNINASPYYRGIRQRRHEWAEHHATTAGVWLAYCHQAGGQDEVVFDGDSFVLDPSGADVACGAQFETDLVVVDVPLGHDARGPEQIAGQAHARMDSLAETYAALVAGTRDYVRGNGFTRALVGLSGGIDSALVATIAADALGPDAVTGVAMPSPHSSPGSVTDARALARNLGIRWLQLPIGDVMDAFARTLAEPFAGLPENVAEENIQPRARGTLLMALSNKTGDIVLATGNKSEYAVGYATLYGDMAGGFAVIKDVPKTLVYQLCRHRNAAAGTDLIPQATIDKPPSAELRPGQLDTDSLPPYDVLDPILEAYVERDESVGEIVARGYDEAVVRRVARLVDVAEYKRRQAAPGVKITPRAFGKDRRLPITQRWSG